MKICFIAGTLGRGGAEKQLYYMLKAVKSAKIPVRLLCLTSGEAWEQPIRSLGVDIEFVGGEKGKFRRLNSIIRSLRQNPADIVQSAHFYTNIYAVLAAYRLRSISIGAIRNDVNSEVSANGIYGRLQLRSPSHLIANSKSGVENAMSFGIAKDRIDLIHNVVDCGFGSRPPHVQDQITIMFAGRLEPQKRPELFIKLARHLSKIDFGTRLRFLMVGGGSLRRRMEAEISNSEFSDSKFSILGEQGDLDQFYSEADILISTSAYEGTPNVVLEAMSYGIPVVATAVGGLRDLLADDRGVAVDQFSFEALVSAASGLVRDAARRRSLGQRAREYVLTNHSFDSMRTTLMDVYTRLGSHRKIAMISSDGAKMTHSGVFTTD